MDRRGFLKRGCALAVGAAFPLPALPAPITFKGVEVELDPLDWWHMPPGPQFVVAGPVFMEEMRRQWALCERLHLTR